MTNTLKSTQTTVAYIADKVDQLGQQREAWEQGSYKQSNAELYALLGKCLELYEEVHADMKKSRALNDYLRSRSNSFRDGTALQTRVVRAVFDPDMGKRAQAYARVIKVASEEKPADETMHDFIVRGGGIEEIRRKKADGKSDAETRRDNIEYAKAKLSTAEPIAPSFTPTTSVRVRPDGAEHPLFVAVVREEANGSYSIVYETAAASIVNATLALAGREQNAAAAHQELAADAAQKAANADEAHKSALANATAA